jgi:DNA modification methylase
LITIHRIINGDSRQMNIISDRSVHLVITSPPYWQLKDYGTDEQIGLDDNYESYINNLNLVWKECYRVLFPGCRLCINIGDQSARSVYFGRYHPSESDNDQYDRQSYDNGQLSLPSKWNFKN